ncbi:MAG TPA: phosphotransferase [Oligoflexia bacterium]|nr:phosphotransferase [Oligoflexia bacterium]HMP47362.1 phosphotransferase [Oligoflexia bacterium]
MPTDTSNNIEFAPALEPDTRIKVLEALKQLKLENEVSKISLVYGDLSPRRYFRAHFKNQCLMTDITSGVKKHQKTIIIMYFDSVNPPEANPAGMDQSRLSTSDEKLKTSLSSFSAYECLSNFFTKHNISVPCVYLFAENLSIILQEDLGQTPLISLAENKSQNLKSYYENAISYIKKFQNIKDESCFAFQRGFDQVVYLREMMECADYFLPEFINKREVEKAKNFFLTLADELVQFPKVLVHRDFHSWNLMIDPEGSLRIIDFQDALIGTRSYDLVALVHERDIDQILGEKLVKDLEKLFFSTFNNEHLEHYEYPRAMLQRDLKVVGRFAKVAKTRGLVSYTKWIPGTAKRILKTLEIIADDNNTYGELHDIFSKALQKFHYMKDAAQNSNFISDSNE